MPDLFVAKKNVSRNDTPPPVREETSPVQKTSHTNGMTVFSEFPGNIQFENQEPDEIIHLFLRRHFVTNVRWMSLSILLILLPPIFITFFLPVLAYSGIVIPANFLLVLLLLYYLILLGYMFTSYVSWFYNIGIVTNMRVVDIDLDDITRKNVAATEMEDLIDVDYRQQGFLQNFFDYGNVHMQIEGIKPNFEFLSVPHPAKVADVISDLMREVQHET